MSSSSLIRSLAVMSLALFVAGPVVAQDAAAPTASDPAEAPAKPKPRRATPAKPAPTKAAAPTPAATPAAGAGWPSGASSVSEVYGDWTVTCAKADTKVECAVMQAQGAKGRREFALEIRPPSDGRAQGFILMPLGLAIEPGVSFKLDEAVLGKGAPFMSCSQEGCLVPVSLPTLATDTMKTAKNLLVSATKPDAKEPVVITVPLEGFANALARAAALAG